MEYFQWIQIDKNSSSKNINIISVKIIKILGKIKESDINIEEIVTIKLMNNWGSSFETHLTILNPKAKYENKISDFFRFFPNEEFCMKQTTKVNLTQSENISLRDILSKISFNSCVQSSWVGFR